MERFPLHDLRNICRARQEMAKVPNGIHIAKISNGLGRVHERYRLQTTDKQTDGRQRNSKREREFMFAKRQIPLRYLDRTSFEPYSVMEFGREPASSCYSSLLAS